VTIRKPEKVEENKFYAKVEAHGWDCVKLTTAGPYGRAGRNDRLVLAMYGVVAFFEFKRIGEDAEKLQSYYHEKLKKLGFETHVVYTCDAAYKILMALVRKAKRRIRIFAEAGIA
jgi:hypothetical protein